MYNTITKSVFLKAFSFALAFCMLHISVSAHTAPKVILKSGTPVELELLTNITSETALPGTTVDFRVVQDLKVDDQLIVKSGEIVRGQIVRSDKAKAIGKAGFVEVRINSLKTTDGKEIYLTQNQLSREGKDKMALSIILGVVICLLFLLIKGENATLFAGEKILTYTAGDYIVE